MENSRPLYATASDSFASPTSGVLAVISMLFLLKLSLIEFDLSLASSETRRRRIQKRLALERDALLRFRWNHLPIIWIIALDQFRNEQRLVEIERDLAAAHAHFHLAIVGEQALQLRDRFRRDNDVGFVAARKFQFDINHGEPAAICRHQGELVVLETEENAVEHVTGLVGRDGIGSLAQTVSQILLTNRDDFRVLKLRQRRELFLRQAKNLEKLWPLRMEAAFFPSTSIWISLEGSSRTMLKRRRAGSVVAPFFSTSASKLPRTPTSRSVVVR